MTNWKKLFREFYDDNECGGSSRWLVAPNIVEMFIDFQLRESLERVEEECQRVHGNAWRYYQNKEDWATQREVAGWLEKIDIGSVLDTELKGLGGKE